MKMLLSQFPEEIVQKYNLNTLAVGGWVSPFGYYPSRHTPGIWLHKTRPISFSLVVDDFAVKYVGKQHDDHLRNALLKTYELTTDWVGKVYSGMTLKWDYKNRTCDIATEKTKVTEKTQAATNQLLDYLAMHQDATIRYHASDIILHIHSDASYLSVSNVCSRLGGLFFLGNRYPKQDKLNGSILNVASVIKNVVASAAE
jgi:hypothetical protein